MNAGNSSRGARFDGPAGWVAARVMARANRQAEAEAVEELAPAPDADVLVVGCGPGVGLRLLADRVPDGGVVGIDPSAAMIRAATRRNRHLVRAGRVGLLRAVAQRLPFADAVFDAVVTVNTLQLWTPLDEAAAQVARVLRPGGRLVSFTHAWAIERNSGLDVDRWADRAGETFERNGLTGARHWRGSAESGTSVAFTARRA